MAPDHLGLCSNSCTAARVAEAVAEVDAATRAAVRWVEAVEQMEAVRCGTAAPLSREALAHFAATFRTPQNLCELHGFKL